MEREHHEPTTCTVEDFLMTFNVASGALLAQALAINGLSLKYKLPVEKVIDELKANFKKLNGEQKQQAYAKMAAAHRHSATAKNTLRGFTKEENFNLEEALYEQFPSRADFKDLLGVLERHSPGTEDDVKRALSSIFTLSSYDQITAELKNVAAYLDLYSSMRWWQDANDAQKVTMIEAGKKRCQDFSAPLTEQNLSGDEGP